MKKLVGGQAVIDGVLMRGPEGIATAVRKKDNTIVYKLTKVSSINKKMAKYPFLRGLIALYDAMIIGIKELIFSANMSGEEEEKLTDKEVKLALLTSFVISVTVFMVAPSMISTFIFTNKLYSNILEAVIRISIFLIYLYFTSKSKEVKTLFEYHGAEHKSIKCYEMDLELTPVNAQKMTRLHPRCGTSFLFLVMIISILVFAISDSIFNIPNIKYIQIIYKFLSRVLLVPVISSLAYELQQLASKKMNSIFSKIVLTPGMWLQKLTTREPNLDQLEVAITALKVSLGEKVDAQEVFE